MRNKKKETLFSRTYSFIKATFIRGFIALFPLSVTVVIVHFTYSVVARWLRPIYQLEPDFLKRIPGAEFILVMLFIFLIGILLKLFILNPIVHSLERLIKRIPLIRSIYSSAQKLVEFFNVRKAHPEGHKVVMIEYPRPGYYNLAFLLGSAKDNFDVPLKAAGKADDELLRVFMPNSPNPTSGYFFILPKSVIVETDITFEDAIKTIVSCGLITPENLPAKEMKNDAP